MSTENIKEVVREKYGQAALRVKSGATGNCCTASGLEASCDPTLSRRIAAETLGTAFLLAAVVGSGIMGERLADGNIAIAVLANTLATGATLIALILTFGPISGAHFNPAVTLADASQGGICWSDAPAYIPRPTDGCTYRRRRGALDVWRSADTALTARPRRWRTAFQRIRRNLRPAVRDFGLCPSSFRSCACSGRSLHHRCILVYGFNVFC